MIVIETEEEYHQMLSLLEKLLFDNNPPLGSIEFDMGNAIADAIVIYEEKNYMSSIV